MLKIKPGILVALRTSVRGGYEYRRTELGTEVLPDGSERTTWETERFVLDPEELERANETRSIARKVVKQVCTQTPWGLVCGDDREDELDEVLAHARSLAAAHNAEAEHTTVHLSAMLGRVARDEEEAVEAIRQEISHLLDDATQALANGDVEGVRQLANKGKAMGRLLEDESEAAGAVEDAVKGMRATARSIVKRVEKAGEDLEAVLDAKAFEPISHARFVFGSPEEVS